MWRLQKDLDLCGIKSLVGRINRLRTIIKHQMKNPRMMKKINNDIELYFFSAQKLSSLTELRKEKSFVNSMVDTLNKSLIESNIQQLMNKSDYIQYLMFMDEEASLYSNISENSVRGTFANIKSYISVFETTKRNVMEKSILEVFYNYYANDIDQNLWFIRPRIRLLKDNLKILFSASKTFQDLCSTDRYKFKGKVQNFGKKYKLDGPYLSSVNEINVEVVDGILNDFEKYFNNSVLEYPLSYIMSLFTKCKNGSILAIENLSE